MKKIKEASYKNKGITLIVLVITIIITIILAGVTIAQLTGKGLLVKVQQAATETKYANAAEKVAIAVNASYDTTGSLNSDYLKDNLNKIDGISEPVENIEYDLKVIVDGFEFTISEYGIITGNKDVVIAGNGETKLPENTIDTDAGTEVALEDGWGTQHVTYIKTTDGTDIKTLETVATVYAVSDGQNNTIPIPNGFYYVGGTEDKGIVISDDVRDKNKYINVTDGNIPDGVVYDTTTGIAKSESSLTDDEKKTVIFGNQFVWIPCSISDYTKYDWGYKNSTEYDTSTNIAELAYIEKYGGFYIGRYEAGTSNITLTGNYTWTEPTGTSNWANYNYTSDKVKSGKITEKAGEIPYIHADYTTAVEMSKAMYNTSSVQSGLMTGTMWDVTLKFITEDSTNYSDLISSPWGNYNSDTGLTYIEGRGRYLSLDSNGVELGAFTKSNSSYDFGIRTTAFSEDAKKKNIYDFAGNLWEWTQETSFSSSKSNLLYNLRGGCYNNNYTTSGNPVCYRVSYAMSGTSAGYGFRAALYIK